MKKSTKRTQNEGTLSALLSATKGLFLLLSLTLLKFGLGDFVALLWEHKCSVVANIARSQCCRKRCYGIAPSLCLYLISPALLHRTRHRYNVLPRRTLHHRSHNPTPVLSPRRRHRHIPQPPCQGTSISECVYRTSSSAICHLKFLFPCMRVHSGVAPVTDALTWKEVLVIGSCKQSVRIVFER